MIFEVDPDQIEHLDSLTLVRLMKQLMLAECRLVGIPLRASTVSLQITVPDGGEDGRVEWTGGDDETEFFPARFSIFQAKAQNLTKGTIAAEAFKKRKAKKPALNEAVEDVLSKNGAYIVFCSYAFTGNKIQKLIKALQSAIEQGGGDPTKVAALDVYDANRIADWVNSHPAVALWLTAHGRRRALGGVLPLQGWARAPIISGSPWVDDGKPRFAPVNIVIPEEDRLERNRNAWTFDQAADAIRTGLAGDKVAVRISGPSGFGKTRFAFEVFNRRKTAADDIENSTIIYADLSVAADEVPKLALEIADSGSPSILVADECPDDIHSKLAELANRPGSRLRLVTLDVETRIVQEKNTLIMKLEPAAGEQIVKIAKAVSGELSDSDLHFIEELALGFPQMAVIAAQWKGDLRQAILSVDHLLDRIVWGKKVRNEEAQRALECACLFDWIGITDHVGSHAAFIASEIAEVSQDRFIEHLKSFKSRGIVMRRGNYLQVGPVPLAARLGANRLSLMTDGKLVSCFAKAPEALKMGLLHRLRWMDVVPEARSFAQALLSSGNLGNFEALKTDFGAECLDRLVHVDPDLAMATIDRVFGQLTIAQLRDVTDGRRHLVWALQKLVFRKTTFEPAATLLRRLAVAETDDRISNNATGQFKQLYQIHLSGTEAEPRARLEILDEGLRSDDAAERALCVDALAQMLHTNGFTRSGGAEEIGSGKGLKDWSPKTYGEQRDFFRAGLTRLSDIAVADIDPLAATAHRIIGSSIRGLINQLPLEEIAAVIGRITEKHGFWPEAVQEINEWLYFDRRNAPSDVGKSVRALFDSLIPIDPVELAVLYTKGWQTDFHDPDVDFDREDRSQGKYDYSTRKSIELAKEIAGDPALLDMAVGRLSASDAKNVFAFTRRLAELSAYPLHLFTTALEKAEQSSDPANRRFFEGIIAGADGHDPEVARACIRKALHSSKLKGEAISMIGAGKILPRDIDLVVSLLQSGEVKPHQCAPLSYGRGMDHLTVEDIAPLLDELANHGAEGLWTILDIVWMVLYGGKSPSRPLIAIIKSTLVAPALFEQTIRRTLDGHHLEEMVKLLIKQGAVDRSFARAMVGQLLSICDARERDLFSTLDGPVRESLKMLMPIYPDVVWKGISILLLTDDWKIRCQLENLLDIDRIDHLGAGLPFSLPAVLYLDWVRKDPDVRAHLVVGWLPIAMKADDGLLSWHPALESFVAEFATRPNVLAEIAKRLRPKTWGTVSQHLEPLISLFESWTDHALPEIRKWVREEVRLTNARIIAAKQENEDDVRFT